MGAGLGAVSPVEYRVDGQRVPSPPEAENIFVLKYCVYILEKIAACVTRKLSCCKDDRAMRYMYGCPENFRESLTIPTDTFPEIFNWL